MNSCHDRAFQEILDRIPERDQAALLQQHSVTTFSELLDKKSQLQQRLLKDVCSDVQMVLEVVCCYVETLDPTSSFTWEGFENFCDYNDKFGDGGHDDSLVFAEEMITKKTASKSGDNGDGADGGGLHLTAEERKQMEQHVQNDPLTLSIRGFSERTLQFEDDIHAKKKIVEEASEKTEVAFNGKVFYVNRCYHYQQENGGKVMVGIRKFTNVSARA